MPKELQDLFKSLWVEHMALYPRNLDDYSEKEARHPAVVKHYVTGDPCIFVADQYHRRIPGMNQALTEIILLIFEHYCRLPELQVRHQWKKGDFAIWDNFLTCHYGVTGNLPESGIRRLYRIAAETHTFRPQRYED
jgi:alpha-ketoglutarate-dependent taurine dioxygenase